MNIEQELMEIKERNRRVERDKAWELSKTRIVTICAITYAIILLYNALIARNASIFITSAVPMIGFFLSTLSLPLVRKIWEKLGVK